MTGWDGIPSAGLHDVHVADVHNPVDPTTLITGLQPVGDGVWEHES